jgi:hypothetical protein
MRPIVVCLFVAVLALAAGTANGATKSLFPAWWLRSALCIHRFEGSWRDPGAPYYGGLQFDLPTWYGSGGGRYAKYPHWATPTQQLIVAYRLWRRAGWAPWPNTSRMCGLR